MRLLVLDQSLILQWLVRHEFPDGLEILSAQDLHEANQVLARELLDAAIVSLPPAQLPWGEFQHRCATHAPPIPVLYETCLDVDAGAIGLDAADGYAAFLQKPASRRELHSALEALLAAAKRGVNSGSGASGQRDATGLAMPTTAAAAMSAVAPLAALAPMAPMAPMAPIVATPRRES